MARTAPQNKARSTTAEDDVVKAAEEAAANDKTDVKSDDIVYVLKHLTTGHEYRTTSKAEAENRMRTQGYEITND